MMLSRGFTLIELMITIAIAAILLSVAVPNFQSFVVNSRITTQANDFISDLALARSEAAKRNTRVTICTSTDQTTCTASAWGAGRIVFVDTGTAGDATGDLVLKVSQPMPGGLTLTGANLPNANYVQFTGRGRLVPPLINPNDTFTGSTFTLCKSGYKGRTITLGRTGRIGVSSAATHPVCA